MFKERYEKPIVKPAECADGLLREKYQKPDIELVDLGVVSIIAASVPDPGANPPPTSDTSPTNTVTQVVTEVPVSTEPAPMPTATPSPT